MYCYKFNNIQNILVYIIKGIIILCQFQLYTKIIYFFLYNILINITSTKCKE